MDFILNSRFITGFVVGMILCHLLKMRMAGKGGA